MARGKQTCRILKEIRRQIAEANDIEFITTECRYKGDCPGTCPKCESEVRYLEQQLHRRRAMGKAVMLAGLSAGTLAMLSPASAQTPMSEAYFPVGDISAVQVTDSIQIKGLVQSADTLKNDTIETEPLIGAVVTNLRTGDQKATDADGKFQITACIGDSLKFHYIGFYPKTIVVTEETPLDVTLSLSPALLGEDTVLGGAISAPVDRPHMFDLSIIDENQKTIPEEMLSFEIIFHDEDGDECSEWIYPLWLYEKGVYRIYWTYEGALMNEDGKPLKEATLRINAEGYDKPVIVKIKYPKKRSKKNIKFKH